MRPVLTVGTQIFSQVRSERGDSLRKQVLIGFREGLVWVAKRAIPVVLQYNEEVAGRESITRLFTLDSKGSKYPNKKGPLARAFCSPHLWGSPLSGPAP